MRGVKLCWLSVCAGLVLGAGNVRAKEDGSCLEQGKSFFAAKKYTQARDTFSRCVKENPAEVEALLSLGGTQLTLEDLQAAEKSFRSAISLMKRSSPYRSYTYSMLGDIALKQQRYDEALNMYTLSLEANVANVNSLIGKGVITEYQGDKKAAAGFYRSALAVEPLNLIARKRLVNLEPEYFTDAEMLAALKQRYALAPDATALSAEDKKLFADIHRAEQRRGVDYLKNKYAAKVPANYTVTLNKDTEFERELLTLEGYQALRKHIGQDAVAVFQRAGVPVQSVFSLRDLKGEKLFNEDSTLTPSGFFAYTEALQNRKRYLLPEESVPPTQERLDQVSRAAEDLRAKGFVQISGAEKKMLETQTKCSEEVLRKELGLTVLSVQKNKRYYFVAPNEPKNAKKSVSYYYVMSQRAKTNPGIKVPSNTFVEAASFYGYTVCLEDGNLL